MNPFLILWRCYMHDESKKNNTNHKEINKTELQPYSSSHGGVPVSPVISRRRRWYQWTQESSTMPKNQTPSAAVIGDGRNASYLLSGPRK